MDAFFILFSCAALSLGPKLRRAGFSPGAIPRIPCHAEARHEINSANYGAGRPKPRKATARHMWQRAVLE